MILETCHSMMYVMEDVYTTFKIYKILCCIIFCRFKQEECPKRRVLCDNVREGCFCKAAHSELAAHHVTLLYFNILVLVGKPRIKAQEVQLLKLITLQTRRNVGFKDFLLLPQKIKKRVASHDISAEKSMINVDSMII